MTHSCQHGETGIFLHCWGIEIGAIPIEGNLVLLKQNYKSMYP